MQHFPNNSVKNVYHLCTPPREVIRKKKDSPDLGLHSRSHPNNRPTQGSQMQCSRLCFQQFFLFFCFNQTQNIKFKKKKKITTCITPVYLYQGSGRVPLFLAPSVYSTYLERVRQEAAAGKLLHPGPKGRRLLPPRHRVRPLYLLRLIRVRDVNLVARKTTNKNKNKKRESKKRGSKNKY